jgi:hypothetical protein
MSVSDLDDSSNDEIHCMTDLPSSDDDLRLRINDKLKLSNYAPDG